jgi:hypothetical protein
MPRYLFVFCYQTPEQLARKSVDGFADENSAALFVEADSAELALEWGKEVAEKFMAFLSSGRSEGWKAMGYEGWLEADPDLEYPETILATLPTVAVSSYPDFSILRS